jgi:hypothetical protein
VTVAGYQLDLTDTGLNNSHGEITTYDPWQDRWENAVTEGLKISLPDFKRSLVVRIKR